MRSALSLLPGVARLVACLTFTASVASGATDPLWTFERPLTAPVVDAAASATYFALGSSLCSVWNESTTGPSGHAAGSLRWTWCESAGSTINSFPSPVPLSSDPTTEYLFVTIERGFLHKVNATTGATVWSYDARRPTCAADQVVATAAIQLYDYSNAAFQSAIGEDLVFVITRHGCGGDATNRVYAVGATSGTTRWTFNAPGTQSVGPGFDGCTIDYTNNRIYCGTEKPTATSPSLWAINSISGSLVWSHNAGSIQSRPQLARSNRLYVGNLSFEIQAFDVSGPSPLLQWITPYSMGSNIRKNLQIVDRYPLPNRIFALNDAGFLHAIEDTPPVPTQVWPPTNGGAAEFKSLGSASPMLGKLYVGRNDGTIQQINLGNGATEDSRAIGLPGSSIPPLAYSSQPPALPENRLVATASSAAGVLLKQFCVPFVSGPCVANVSAPIPIEAGEWSLGPSAPNPFTAATRIQFQLPRPARVELVVYDIAGTHVRTLARSEQPAGPNTVAWDGLDDSGRAAPSGIYFYRLRASAPGYPAIEESRRFTRVR